MTFLLLKSLNTHLVFPFSIGTESSHPCHCGCHRRLAIGSHIAMEMRQQLHQELGITSCAGVAHNKLLAKLVGEKHKPNDQTTLFPGNAERLMLNLEKVRKIPGEMYKQTYVWCSFGQYHGCSPILQHPPRNKLHKS